MLLAFAGLMAASPAPRAEGGNGPRAGEFVLDVAMTVAAEVGEPVRDLLTAEAHRIWRREGVFLRWRDGAAVRPDAPLRVLVIARPGVPSADANWVVGELLRLTDRRAIAVASITGARRVLDEADRWSPTNVPDEVQLGLVLGRAVAHEIGHYLLGTRGHSRAGLMRADFSAREFTGVHAGGAFLLHGRDRRRMRDERVDRLAAMRILHPAVPAATD